MVHDVLAAVGAFMSGMGAVLGAVWTLRRVQRHERDLCATRIAELDRAHQAGLAEGLHLEQRHENP